MFLGIEKLEPCYSSLELSGLFVITAPSFSFVKSIFVQTVIENPDTKTALLSFEKRHKLFDVSPVIQQKLAAIYQDGNLFLNTVYLDGDERRLFSNIKQDMDKKVFDAIDLILIEFDQDCFSLIPETALNAVLEGWQNWLKRHKKTCVWLIHGDMAASLVRNKFLTLNNSFNGLANIEFDVSEIKYELIFWHLHTSVQSNVLLNLNFQEATQQLSVAESNALELKNTVTLSLSKNNRVLVFHAKKEGREIFPREWEVFDSIDDVEMDIISNSATTIIIYIDANINVNAIAEKVLELRKHGGMQLKIILHETEHCLRNIEEKFILNSGANLIVPHEVTFLRFETIVYAMQSSYFMRNVPNKIEDIYQINLNDYGKGYLPLGDFISQVTSLDDSAQRIETNPSLIKLTLNRAIPIEEISALIEIVRRGDIFTFTENYLYLFLFQCEQFEVRKALSHLIALPIEDLFLEHEFFSYIDEIRNEIREIALETREKSENDYQTLATEHIKQKGAVARKAAIPIFLTLKTSQP